MFNLQGRGEEQKSRRHAGCSNWTSVERERQLSSGSWRHFRRIKHNLSPSCTFTLLLLKIQEAVHLCILFLFAWGDQQYVPSPRHHVEMELSITYVIIARCRMIVRRPENCASSTWPCCEQMTPFSQQAKCAESDVREYKIQRSSVNLELLQEKMSLGLRCQNFSTTCTVTETLRSRCSRGSRCSRRRLWRRKRD